MSHHSSSMMLELVCELRVHGVFDSVVPGI